jgi:protein-S-isoprenylcysteine O-methyltransferase Ste14
MRTGIPPLALTGLAGVAMWAVARGVPQLTWELRFGSALAVPVAFAGLAVCLLGVLPFRRVRTTLDPTRPERASTLVTGGIFRVTRNPMYLGMLLVLIAWGVYLSSALGLLLGPPAFVLYLNRFQIAPEERALASAFGREYTEYAQRVRRWV